MRRIRSELRFHVCLLRHMFAIAYTQPLNSEEMQTFASVFPIRCRALIHAYLRKRMSKNRLAYIARNMMRMHRDGSM